METVTDLIFLGSRITIDGDCSHEIKTLAPWKNSYDQPRQYIKKQRDTLPTKVCLVKADRKSTRLNSSHSGQSRMPSSA